MVDQSTAAFQSWQYDVNQTNDLNKQLDAQKQRLEDLLSLMGQVPPSVAFNMLIPAAMLMVSNQNTSDMEIQASQGNEESDVLTLINITQSDNNYLASNSTIYQNASTAVSKGAGNQAVQPPMTNSDGTAMTNQQFVTQYENTYNESIESQNYLLRMFQDSNPTLYPNAKDPQAAGWCNDNYASSMISAINSWSAATNDLSAPVTGETPGQDPSYYYSLHLQEYASDPASSTYAPDVSNLTTAINTEQSANNSMQSQIQGIIKSLMTLAQQYEGSTKSAGKSIIQEKDYWVQQQNKN